MRAKAERTMYLSSRITLKARLMTSMQSVRMRMSCYPAMKQVSRGTRLVFLIENGNAAAMFNTVELEADRISLTTTSSTSPTYFLKDSVLRLISISTALAEDYYVDFSGVLPHVIYLLSDLSILRTESSTCSIDRNADMILSGRIIGLLRQKKTLEDEYAQLKSGLVRVLSELILCRYPDGFDAAQLSRELGLPKGIVCDSISGLAGSGYKVIGAKGRVMRIVRA